MIKKNLIGLIATFFLGLSPLLANVDVSPSSVTNGDFNFVEFSAANAANNRDNSQGSTIQSSIDQYVYQRSNRQDLFSNYGSQRLFRLAMDIEQKIAFNEEKLSSNNPSSDIIVPWRGLNNSLNSPQSVIRLYESMNYNLLWTEQGRVSQLAASVIEACLNAWQHGLRPSTYHTLVLSSLSVGSAVKEKELFDIVLTDAFITLKKHLANGTVDPNSQLDTWNQRPKFLDFPELYYEARQSGNANAILWVNNLDYQYLLFTYVSLKQGDLPATVSTAHNSEKLALSMERLRWQEDEPEGSYVWVNIPAYKMFVRNKDQYLFESKAIVGRKERPTPIFKDRLKRVVLSPYWHVPETIFEKDKLPKLLNDPLSLGEDMQPIQLSTGKVVDVTSVDWENDWKNYRLRQMPGGRNALGYVKFLFPNKHAIYMHDTPQRELFGRKSRMLSSGCVRLEKAEDFALFLLNDQGYNRELFYADSRRTKETWVDLEEPKQYPVYINYLTAWPDKYGNIAYGKDIYGHDRTLAKAYTAATNREELVSNDDINDIVFTSQ